MQAVEDAVVDLTEVAASHRPLTERAGELLARLRRIVPFDSAWMAHVDVLRGSYHTVCCQDLDQRVRDYLAGPGTADDIDAAGATRPGPPIATSDVPSEELRTWSECLQPAGYHESLGVALYGSDRRHVGFLTLLPEDQQPPEPQARRALHKLTPLLADPIDPTRSLLPAARLVQGATAGIVLRTDGATQELPGLTNHDLLQSNSDVL